MNINFNSFFQAFRPPVETQSVPKKLSSSSSQLGYFKGQAIVEQTIQPGQTGRVRFKGSHWSARCEQAVIIPSGEIVNVIGGQQLVLVVEPAFLLSASKMGLTKLRQALEQRGWMHQDPDWLMKPETDLITVLSTDREGNQLEAIAVETWRRFVQGKPIYISTFKACCKAVGLNWKEVVGYGDSRSTEAATAQVAPEVKLLKAEPSSKLHFLGRSKEIADLTRLVAEGANMILILGEGGMGKTTLARQYFRQVGCDRLLECWMAKETQNLHSAESVVQGWLQQHFDEEPAREFYAALEQLRYCLRESCINGAPAKIGVLIDNLEPALDREGQVIEARRGYVDLLEVLSDPTLPSTTLITSREPLHEPSVIAHPYVLSGLEQSAWQEFFSLRQLQLDPIVLEQMHQAYMGNAKAMTILSSAISVDFQSDMSAFWQEHQTNLLHDTALENLVNSHFDRLQQVYPEAYRLLYRLGCYRFQDQVTLPLEGMFCLLWDVPREQHRSIVRFLRDLFLIESYGDEYRLHPVIHAKAIAILKASPDWQQANRQAAEFWTAQVQTVMTTADALTAFEAYYHYREIGDLQQAAAVLLRGRDNQWQKQEPLGTSFYRLGLLRRMISAITLIIDEIQPGYALSKLHNILGDLYWLKGEIHDSIAHHEQSRAIAIQFFSKDLEIVSLFNMGLCRMALWEIDEATTLFVTVSDLAENTECHIYAVGAWFCLAFLRSQQGQEPDAFEFIRKVSNEYSKLSASSWSRGYSLLYIGWALRNLQDLDRSVTLHTLAKDYADQSGYTQVKAGALNGLAAVYRDRQDYSEAIAHHLEAIRLLERIEAKGDLAEAYYQLGLTYQTMRERAESETHFQTAIGLFQQMNAPKQVERVQRSIA